MAYWVDEMTFGVGPGLGKVVYQHIHDDDTSHPCQITPLTSSGAWGGMVGQYNPDVRIECLDCRTILQENDEICTKTKKEK